MDYEKLYEELRCAIDPPDFMDKRTPLEAHRDAMQQAKYLHKAMDRLYADMSRQVGREKALARFRKLPREVAGITPLRGN